MTEAEKMRRCTMKNKEYISGKCLKKCKENVEARNPTTLKCDKVKEVLSEDVCNKKHNKEFNQKTRRCVKKCTATQKRDKDTMKCVSNKTRRSRVSTPLAVSPDVKSPNPDNIITSVAANDLHHSPDVILPSSLSNRSLADFKNVCNSDYCITFGFNVDKINQYFGHYIDLNYVIGISKLNEGVNGFILKLNYNRDHYATSALVKSNLNNGVNLAYEYMVGKFINKYNKIFPSFIETYQILKYKSGAARKRTKELYNNVVNTDTEPFKKSVVAIQDININNIGTTCTKFDSFAILIQYINNATTLEDLLQTNLHFVNYELLNVLYQVYAPLSIMSDVFSHYDLHTRNVILLKPYDDLYIEYVYHYPDGKMVRFNSQYIAKIIDYGYSYFNDTSSSGTNSGVIRKTLCADKTCGNIFTHPLANICTLSSGYDNLGDVNKKYFLQSSIRNKSTDLRLLFLLQYNFSNKYPDFSTISHLSELLNDVQYNLNVGTSTIEVLNPPNGSPESSIWNVMQAKERIEDLINRVDVKKMNKELTNGLGKAGTLHIYTDGSAPMKYVPFNP